MKRKKILILVGVVLGVGLLAYASVLYGRVNRVKTILRGATRAVVTAQVPDEKDGKRRLEKTITNKEDLNQIFDLTLRTKNPSMLTESPLLKSTRLAAAWRMYFEVYSNETHVATISLLNTRVALDDQVAWNVSDDVDIYGGLVEKAK